ncbi:hypothetical protein [Nostoc sp. FACHB-190]|uniref:hypothetical protein n=1 Tax=Nostoc sp. FACHB-190 TaxID=2692838 RepID=UPI0016842DD9|nr:hypothetical protein [Nostoc sp. FACHB-190]MBD2303620.1 hypothetical protein [Nostoc sp. FACHB-190]
MNINQKYIIQIVNIINNQKFSDTPKNREFLQGIADKLRILYKQNNSSKILNLLVSLEVKTKLISSQINNNNEHLVINPASIFGFKINNDSPSTNLKMLPKI